MLADLRRPIIGTLLLFLLGQQLIFGAFQIMFAPYTRLNSIGNTIAFVFIGILIVVIQGFLIRRLTDVFGERRLIIGGFMAFAVGLFIFASVSRQPVPWYIQADIVAELKQGTTTTESLSQIQLLPPEDHKGILGLAILLVAFLLPAKSSWLNPIEPI